MPYRLTDISAVRELMSRHGVDFKKSLGQNFLIAESVPRRIAAYVEGERVLEIGPGIGTLTAELCRVCPQVEAVELDRALMPVLEETLAGFDCVRVTNADFMKLDHEEFAAARFGGQPYSVAANLPYYITSPVLMKLMESGTPPGKIVVMVQKEVAARLSARPGTAEYGAVTAAVAWFGSVKRCFDVPAGCFMPRPRVDSAVIEITRFASPPASLSEGADLRRVIRGAFAQRRKTLLNSLASVYPEFTRPALEAAVRAAGLDPAVRGETLGIPELAALANRLAETS